MGKNTQTYLAAFFDNIRKEHGWTNLKQRTSTVALPDRTGKALADAIILQMKKGTLQ